MTTRAPSVRDRAATSLKWILPHAFEIGSYDKARVVELFLDQEEAGSAVRTLDVGSGNGFFTAEAQARGGGHCVGITIAERERSSATAMYRDRLGPDRLDFICQSLDEFASRRSRAFDQVLMLDVLEHIRDDLTALEKVGEVLVDGGRIIVTVPDRDNEWRRKTQVSHDETGWHVRNGYTFEQLEELLERAGFEPIDRRRYGNRFSCWLIRLQSSPLAYGKLWVKALLLPAALPFRNVVSRRPHTIGIIARKQPAQPQDSPNSPLG